MSNILILHSGLEGITNACLKIAKLLEQSGHKVHTATMRDQQQKVEACTLSYIKVQPIKINYHKDKSFIQLLNAATLSKRKFFKSLHDKLEFSRFDQILLSKNIDAILIDMELHEYIMYAHVKSIPFVLINQWFSIWQTQDNLPLQSCRFPNERIDSHAEWKRFMLRGKLKSFAHAICTLGLTRKNFIKYLAQAIGFDINQLQPNHFPLPYANKTMPTISMTHPDLEFSKTSVDHLDYVFPMVYEERVELISEQFRVDFQTISNDKLKMHKKLIVATHTTMKGGKQFGLSNLLDALTQVEETISIVSVGSQYSDALNKKYREKGIYIFKTIPQLMALREADLCIHHGGIHTINECIHFKVPMVVISGYRHDQNGCAVRVSEFGCAEVSCKKDISSNEIVSMINAVLTVPSYRKKIEELNATYIKALEESMIEEQLVKCLTNNNHTSS